MLAAGRRVAHDFLFPRTASVNSSLSRKRASLARPYVTLPTDEIDGQGVKGGGVVAWARRSAALGAQSTRRKRQET